ncbi:MAG: hypothetical protein E3J72_21260 [Planctomycetota bacterium]|nr:MAG: hypothetical protein E3J72_21260 [Planctomycetota bacterium]
MPLSSVPQRIPLIRPLEIVILFCIIAFTVTICIQHTSRDLTPPSDDDAIYLAESFKLYAKLCKSGLKRFSKPLLRAMPEKPPLLTLLPLLVFPFRGFHDIETAKLVLAFSLLFLMLFTYLLARRHIRAPGALAAAMLAASTPMTIILSHRYYAELPTAACLVAFIYFVDRSDLFRRPHDTIFAGLCFALGILLKIFFFFMGGSIIILALVLRFREEPELRKKPGVILFGCAAAMLVAFGIGVIAGASGIVLTLIGFCFAGLVGALAYFGELPWRSLLATAAPGAVLAAIVAGPWYLINGQTTWQYFVKYALGPQILDPFNVPPTSIWVYALHLFNSAFGFLLISVVLGFGIWGIIKLRELRPHLPLPRFWLLLAVWGVLPVIVFAVPSRRVARVLLPVVPAFAIGAGALISVFYLDRVRLNRIVALIIGILAAANILYVSFGPRAKADKSYGLTLGPFYIVRDPNPPLDKEWNHDAIHHLIRIKHKGLRQLLTVRHTPTMNRNNLYCAGSLWSYKQFVYYGYHDWRSRGYVFPGEEFPESAGASKPAALSLGGMFIIDERVAGENIHKLPEGVAQFRARLEAAVKAGYAKELSSKPYKEPNGSIIYVWAISGK